jgi:hypothetical protein
MGGVLIKAGSREKGGREGEGREGERRPLIGHGGRQSNLACPFKIIILIIYI